MGGGGRAALGGHGVGGRGDWGGRRREGAGRWWRHQAPDAVVSSLQGWARKPKLSCFPRCFLQISGLPTAPSCSLLSPPLPSCSSPQGTLSSLTQARPVALGRAWTGRWEVWASWGNTSRQGVSAEKAGQTGHSQRWRLGSVGSVDPGGQRFSLKWGGESQGSLSG